MIHECLPSDFQASNLSISDISLSTFSELTNYKKSLSEVTPVAHFAVAITGHRVVPRNSRVQ